MNTSADPALIRSACERMRARYYDLYELPPDRFRDLVERAVWAGINDGSFRDVSTFDMEWHDGYIQ